MRVVSSERKRFLISYPLLAPLLSDEDMHTAQPARGASDTADDGIRMAGIAAYFSFEDDLEDMTLVVVNHFLESVKLFDYKDDNEKSGSMDSLKAFHSEGGVHISRSKSRRTMSARAA